MRSIRFCGCAFGASALVLIHGRESLSVFLLFLSILARGPQGRLPTRRRCRTISIKDLQINEAIRDREVRVISDSGEQLGIMSAAQALKLAESKNLDLVKFAPQAKPPVCKIVDYGKYRFEQAKREKENKKNQRIVEIKEIRLSLNIDTHDFNTKAGHAKRFLEEGNKVKVSIRFRGREMAHPEIGLKSMEKFAQALEEFGTVEKPAKLEGRQMLMFLASKAKPANS